MDKRSKIYRPPTLVSSRGEDFRKKFKIFRNSSNEVFLRKPIDDAVATSVQERIHLKPTFGMHIRCKIPGKSDKLKGTLEFLGHIKNLPKRSSVVVAGLQLDTEEDLGTDGTFLGKRYFVAPAKRGYFVPFKNCVPV